MSTSITIAEMAAAMYAAHYRQQEHKGRRRVAVWDPCSVYPQLMWDTPADRRSMLRTATGLKRPPYSDDLWREIVALLPLIPSESEFDAANVSTAEESHAKFDNSDLVGGTKEAT